MNVELSKNEILLIQTMLELANDDLEMISKIMSISYDEIYDIHFDLFSKIYKLLND